MQKTEARKILRLGEEASASEVQKAYGKRIDEIRKRFAGPGEGMRAQYQRESAAIGEARDCLLAQSGVTDNERGDGGDGRGQLASINKSRNGTPMATEAARKQAPAQDQAGQRPVLEPDETRATQAVESVSPIDVRLKPGQLFAGQFELQRELETSVTGPVWLAHDYNFRRAAEHVALKFLPDSITGDNAAAGELKREILRRITLKHPNILRIVDLLESHGTVAIQMEWVDGQSLSQLRITKPSQVFEVRDLKTWIQQLCLALDYAHQEIGIIHGDLRPDNLVVGPTGSLKLKDFGLERCIRNAMSRSEAGSQMSTRTPNQSPQPAAGKKNAIPDDIYSVGATIYECLTSKLPFYSSNLPVQPSEEGLTSMSKRRTELGIKGDSIPSNWEETVAACLARDPAQRPVSAKEVARRLETDSSSPSVPPTLQLPRPPGPRRWPLIAGILLLLAFLSVIAFHYFYPAGYNPSASLSPGSPSAVGAKGVLNSTPSATPGPTETSEPGLRVTANPSPQPNATLPPAANSTASTEISETPSPEATPPFSGGSNTAASPEQSASPTQQETVTSTETPPPGASATYLSPSEIDATKEEVVNRIDALPGMNDKEKADLIGKMDKAHSMERLVVVPFEIGQTVPGRTVADELVNTFSKPEMRDKLSDPTIILVVAGYADKGGPVDLNLRLSQERAASVSKILKQRLKLSNAIQTVGMGGTELLSNGRPDQNRAVEVWAVAPL